jgi:small subunit ribosomal protein S6
MPLYDLMLLLDPTAPSERQDAILKEVDGLLKSGGTVRGDFDWGTRKLAFEINHRPEAAYHLVQFETASGGELLDRIDHSLKIMDGVLRHRIIRLKDNAPPPPMPRPEGRREHESPIDGAGEPGAPAPEEPAAAALPPEQAAPADVPAIADAAPAEQPAAPAEQPAADAEQPAADADAPVPAPAGGDGEDAPSGDPAAS